MPGTARPRVAPHLQAAARKLQVYAVNLVINGEEKKAYIGFGDAHKEYLAKQYQVPPKMKEDFAKYKPYKTFFHLTILEEACASVPHMHEREQWFIENYKGVGTRKKKHGYNTLSGHPPSSAQFRFLRDKGLLRSQKK